LSLRKISAGITLGREAVRSIGFGGALITDFVSKGAVERGALEGAVAEAHGTKGTPR
jgi:hypothetical protein